ncbi:hypothetical protein [Paenibacillus puerhi]|uniref:hypothetical protein n=1 Tax=Paenibacillus puerhi TaxID=2692622 RepID=UPI00135A1787|nr:hypothetical protein [Paenibacillus puerhi]
MKKKLLTSTVVVGVLVGAITTVSFTIHKSSWLSFTGGEKYTPAPLEADTNLGAGPLSTSTLVSEEKIHPSYFRNKEGKTFGSAIYAETEEQMPDFVKAYGVGGTRGYLKKEDMHEEMPKTREEALALTLARKDREIPLYDVDGETLIGVFLIQTPRTEEFEIQSQHQE